MEVSVGGEAMVRLAASPTQLVDAAGPPSVESAADRADGEQGPVKRARKNKRRRKSPWTPRLVSLIVVGLLSGGLGLALIFYAVLIRASDGS